MCFDIKRRSFNCVCRDNSKLSSCGGDRQVFYWDVATGRVIRKFRGHDSEVSDSYFSAMIGDRDNCLINFMLVTYLTRLLVTFEIR